MIDSCHICMRAGRREAVCGQVLLACEPTEDR